MTASEFGAQRLRGAALPDIDSWGNPNRLERWTEKLDVHLVGCFGEQLPVK
ncbi:hypothetical protein [Kamptonema formosum]|uniref:hypothetical protein n=1 Tax=Kamptonema formosum TaxID=331992 RepID=UPI000345CA75|nr:hypothetical protein [Oscillatoria sp. PCC 10802]